MSLIAGLHRQLVASCALLALGACGGPSPMVRVTVTATPEVVAVSQLRATVSLDQRSDMFVAPEVAGVTLAWPRTFAVDLPTGTRGTIGIRVEGLDARGGIVALGVVPAEVTADSLFDAALELGCSGSACVPASGPPVWVRVADSLIETNEADVVRGISGATIITVGSAGGFPMAYYAETDTWKGFPGDGFVSSVYNAGALGPDGAIYATGGQAGQTGATRYDPDTHHWDALPPMNMGRSGHTMQSFAGRVFAMGSNSSVETFTPGASAWVRLKDLPDDGFRLRSTTTAEHLYVFGGGASEQLEYDAANDHWSTIADPVSDHVTGGVATGGDGWIYFVGGSAAGTGTLALVEAYSPSGKRWVTKPSLGLARQSIKAARGIDGRVYAVGGSAPDMRTPIVEAYGPRFVLASAHGAAGDTIQVSGDNFASDATVRLTVGSTLSAPAGMARSNSSGKLPAGASLKIPSLPSGDYTVTAIDNRSSWEATSVLHVD